MNTAVTYKRIASESDLRALIRLYEETFEVSNPRRPSNSHILSLLNNPLVIFLAAYLEGHIVGGLTAYLLPSVYSEQNEMYLYDMAVSPRFQRQGLGRGLLDSLNALAESMNASCTYVQADAGDEGALAFYRMTGGQEQDVRQFVYRVGENGK